MNEPNDRLLPRDGDEEESLVAFFEALRAAGRATYEALAARDRKYGEDVSHEANQS